MKIKKMTQILSKNVHFYEFHFQVFNSQEFKKNKKTPNRSLSVERGLIY